MFIKSNRFDGKGGGNFVVEKKCYLMSSLDIKLRYKLCCIVNFLGMYTNYLVTRWIWRINRR